MKLRFAYLLTGLLTGGVGAFLLWLPFATKAVGWVVVALCVAGGVVVLAALSAWFNALRLRPNPDIFDGIIDTLFAGFTWF